jgi:hypothetical protein
MTVDALGHLAKGSKEAHIEEREMVDACSTG